MIGTLLGMLIILVIHFFIPVIIGLAIVGIIISAKQAKFKIHELFCIIDADYPPGYICVGGKCVPEPSV